MSVVKGLAEFMAGALLICAVVASVYFAAKWLFFWEPTLFVILAVIFVFLAVVATS